MSAPLPWLGGRRALLAGEGEALTLVGDALRAAGADVAASGVRPGAEERIAYDLADADPDILVHGGTVGAIGDPASYDLAAWRDHVSADIDLRFLQSAEFARRRLAAGKAGAILFLLPSPAPRAGHAGHATVIGALDNLVKSLAVEWARDGIRVNGIASRACEPGGLTDPAVRASLGHLAAYLSSDYAAYISGMVMGLNEL